ncbi:MAG: T9SS type A sorting domain-containing protein, partial [Calditrichaeota bacterium]|nr:T9SS type A sorting domain-containing protein [Calditrichota bacterium]
FNLLLNIEDQDDWLRLQVSAEGGDWTTVWEATGYIGGWQEQEIFLYPYIGFPDVRLRFLAESDGDGSSTLCLVDDLELTTADVGVADPVTQPLRFSLTGAWPNPFNPGTTISFELPHSAPVRLELYNLQGQLVRHLLDESLPAGKQQLSLDGSSLSSGVYIVHLAAPGASDNLKLLLLK